MTITFQNVGKSHGSRVLFEEVSLTFNPGQRVGLTGPNGAGKSTLFGMIEGREELTQGEIRAPKRLGILRQNIDDYADEIVLNAVIMGNERLSQALAERDLLYQSEMTDEIGMRLGELEMIIAEEDGYTAESDALKLLEGMGINEESSRHAMRLLPKDQQFRVLLCQALFGDPKALLLDEPTNHLDLTSIGWLESFLKDYRGTLVVISHDRHFLNAVTTHIADIDYETIIFYPGNYDDMIEAKIQCRKRAEDEAKSKDKKIAKLKEFVARFGAGTRASQVKSRQREILKNKPQELKSSNIQRPYIRFLPSEKKAGKIVLKAEGTTFGYDTKEIISNFSLEVTRGEKIAIIGNNGLGKTTLLKGLAGLLPPRKGSVSYGHQVEFSYFPQNHDEVVDKKSDMTLTSFLEKKRTNLYEQEIRSALGKMLFSGDDAFKKISQLSGGETARLILAGITLEERNLLLLDEPNNHLDLEAVSALAWAIDNYPETVIFVSHDRSLIEEAAKKLIILTDKGIEVYNGTLAEYEARLKK